MHATLPDPSPLAANREPRSLMFWAALGVLVAAQLAAFWILCNEQVNKAEARQSEVTARQMAMTDCLQSGPGATIASCSARIVIDTRVPAVDQEMASIVPVSFQTR